MSVSLGQDNRRLFTGVCKNTYACYSAMLARSSVCPVQIFLVANPRIAAQRTEEIALQAKWLQPEKTLRVLHFPEYPPPGIDSERRLKRNGQRLSVLTHLLRKSSEQTILVATPEAIMGYCPDLAQLREKSIEIRCGQTHSFSAFVSRLLEHFNYDAEAICEYPGQMATRGGLIDIYPHDADRPYRIDFFGDEIESIRSFDPLTQRSSETYQSLFIPADLEPLKSEKNTNGRVLDSLPDSSIAWVLEEPNQLVQEHPQRFSASANNSESLLPLLENTSLLPAGAITGLSQIDQSPTLFKHAERIEAATEPIADYLFQEREKFFQEDPLQQIQDYRERSRNQVIGWSKDEALAICFAITGDSQAQTIEAHLKENRHTASLEPIFLKGQQESGFIIRGQGRDIPDYGQQSKNGIVLMTAAEYLGIPPERTASSHKMSPPARSQIDHLLDFSELAEGDPLVHLQHGICLYRGLTQLEQTGKAHEVISVEFADSVILHVPLHHSHLLTRYIGLNKKAPKPNKIGGASWEKTRAAAEVATLDYAASLLNLQAARKQATGCACPPDHPWQQALEDAFPYNETPDQLRAIEATKADMEKDQPMDRLVCGDVGFGKTEVAVRAALKAVLSERQVAILVPTTVLCQQHANTFRERFAGLPINIGTVSRFHTAAENRKTIEQAAAGGIDILIGTHRLLSSDVHFNRLGLIIVDEEQRFGVKQKEALKQFRSDCHLLTLSATPIPRTLHMAMAGARSMSVIETPPVNRKPIQTIVRSYDAELVSKAIREETQRGGQVFYLHNRVATIESVAARLREMHPDLKIAVGHGQMEEHTLERIMTRFVAGDFQVLVCTTIIESGIDIPNCNTLIIEGADRFGLAQLYQIRGRVGRFKRQAYAYLLLHRHAVLVEKAQKRLHALRQHNQLGAGLRIAMRDLELRGAGNLLGSQQSGHIAGVGFELYCQLLQQSVARLKNDPEAKRIRAEIRLDFITGGRASHPAPNNGSNKCPAPSADKDKKQLDRSMVQAILPDSYIPQAKLRIDFYRQLALVQNTETTRHIAEELTDRFGPPPEEVQVLIAISRLRIKAEEAGLSRVETDADRLICQLATPSGSTAYLKRGSRFPRLTRKEPLPKIQEIEQIIRRLKTK